MEILGEEEGFRNPIYRDQTNSTTVTNPNCHLPAEMTSTSKPTRLPSASLKGETNVEKKREEKEHEKKSQ